MTRSTSVSAPFATVARVVSHFGVPVTVEFSSDYLFDHFLKILCTIFAVPEMLAFAEYLGREVHVHLDRLVNSHTKPTKQDCYQAVS